jgi:hypothetical protein
MDSPTPPHAAYRASGRSPTGAAPTAADVLRALDREQQQRQQATAEAAALGAGAAAGRPGQRGGLTAKLLDK